jgi:hypothetical protein
MAALPRHQLRCRTRQAMLRITRDTCFRQHRPIRLRRHPGQRRNNTRHQCTRTIRPFMDGCHRSRALRLAVLLRPHRDLLPRLVVWTFHQSSQTHSVLRGFEKQGILYVYSLYIKNKKNVVSYGGWKIMNRLFALLSLGLFLSFSLHIDDYKLISFSRIFCHQMIKEI